MFIVREREKAKAMSWFYMEQIWSTLGIEPHKAKYGSRIQYY